MTAPLDIADLPRLWAGRSGPSDPSRLEWIDRDAALGRVAAACVDAPHDLPPHPISRVDGFVWDGSTDGLTVQGESLPGDPVPPPLQPGQAMRVMTGGPLPPDHSGSIPHEQTVVSNGVLQITDPTPVAALPTGGRIRQGSTVLADGALLTPEHLATLAECGIDQVRVWPRPTVTLLATGSELGRAGHYDSNTPHLAALCQQVGADITRLPPVPDRLERIVEAVRASTGQLIITTGGSARGDHDHSAEAMDQAGFTLLMDGLKLRPGRTVRLAARGDRLWLSLPGMPGAMAVLFALLAAPLLRVLSGMREVTPRWRTAQLAVAASAPPGQPLLSAARIEYGEDGCIRATPEKTATDGWVLLPEGAVAAGTVVAILLPVGSG